jgi:hypothetical protein
MSRSGKKQRQKAKREAKRREARRRDALGPIRRLAAANGEIEYWMSQEAGEVGQLQMFVYKRAGGLSGLAAFLVDRGVVGLKDAWVRLDIERGEFDEILQKCTSRDIRMRRADVEQLRRWVAGGMRWAYENGMRLPKDWTRPASLLGGVSDWMSADVSGFIKEFAGHPEDLRQRLIGEPLETYLKRNDISFIFSDSAPYLDQQTGEYAHGDDMDELNNLDEDELESIAADIPAEELNLLVDRFTPSASALAKDTASWLAARGETPAAELFEAWRSILFAAMLSKTAMPDAPEEDIADFGYELLKDMSSRIEETHFSEYDRAVGQVLEHLQTDSDMMRKAVLKHGLKGDPQQAPR